MVKNTPPMGWNTWNTFAEKINEELVLSSADVLLSSGLKDAGYEYVVIDDCWALRERDKAGRMVPDPEKFPHGMKYVADYLHARGLKFGMYSCCGTMTCAEYPASYDREYLDAAVFAEWGVDFLKYDSCFTPVYSDRKTLYRRMRTAGGTFFTVPAAGGSTRRTRGSVRRARICGARRGTFSIRGSP